MSELSIKKSTLSFPVIFQKTEEVDINDCRFTKVKVWLMHLGENFNGGSFEKSVVDKALPTLDYIPIVGFIEENSFKEDDFSDHRYIVIKDDKGKRRKYKGSAYGVIMSSNDNDAHYEERLCDDGETRTYLVVDGLLWNMFEDSSEIMNRDLIKSNSMELWDDDELIDGYEDDNGIFHFTKFSFRAACILGKNCEPAMMNSTIEVQFSMNDFVNNLQEELNDKFTKFSKLINDKGGINNMPKLDTDFAQTLKEQIGDISAIVRDYEIIKDRWGYECPRYELVDVQDTEVIVCDKADHWRYYGMPFTINGDKPVVNFEEIKRKKIKYEDYADSDPNDDLDVFDFSKYVDEIKEDAYNKVTEAETKAKDFESQKEKVETDYTQVKADYDQLKPKYDELVEAEQKRIETEISQKKDSEFAKYGSVLSEDEDFISLKEKKSEYSLEEIESKCAIIYARKNLALNNYTKNKISGATVGIPDEEHDDDTDGYIVTKYGNIPIRR